LHKRLKNKFNLVISGSGNWDMLIKTFPKKSLNKTVFIHRDSIWPYHIIKDAFCTVNINRSEGLGISLIESIALNVPALSYDNGGCTNTLEKYQPNYIIRENDIRRMENKINNLDPSINPNILKQFNWQVILTKYVNLMI
jgi:glycosyltransferase involved in cell wall biosynthesis